MKSHLRKYLDENDKGRAVITEALGVDNSTLTRWLNGASLPTASHQQQFFSFLNGSFENSASSALDNEFSNNMRDKFEKSLKELRESLHRSSRFSSRNEALDELTKLIFAHVSSTANRGFGIESIGGPDYAVQLKKFVQDAFSLHFPQKLKKSFRKDWFELRLEADEDHFSNEIRSCFTHISGSGFSNVFSGAKGSDILNEVFGQFLTSSFSDEKEFGQYLTPDIVVKAMVRLGLASLEEADQKHLLSASTVAKSGAIIDPSCGTASFLTEAAKQLLQLRASSNTDDNAEWLSAIFDSTMVGLDKSERMLHLAATNLALFGSISGNLFLTNSLRPESLEQVGAGIENDSAALILSNPPFGAEFSGDDLKDFQCANEWSDRRPTKVNSEVLFVERYLQWLKPNGVLVAIVPDSILFNKGVYGALRRGLSGKVSELTCISLPSVTFGAAGTNTKTSILMLKKSVQHPRSSIKSYFGICGDIGYSVVTKGTHKRKVLTGRGELDAIIDEAIGLTSLQVGVSKSFQPAKERWDANFHSSLGRDFQKILEDDRLPLLADFVELVGERCDPRRFQGKSFNYIEISDVDGTTNDVKAKSVECQKAPSRARKRVHMGDILVSTVRPERSTIGIVPERLDGAVCTTGFAVLRSKKIHPRIIANFLQQPFCTRQIMRNNVGISYPSIEEECLLQVRLPINLDSVSKLTKLAIEIDSSKEALDLKEKELSRELSEVLRRVLPDVVD